MSIFLNINFLCSNNIGQPGSIENLLNNIISDGYVIRRIIVGSYTQGLHAQWRDYDDIKPSELNIAYEEKNLSFAVIDPQIPPIVLTFQMTWENNNVSGNYLRAITRDTTMFTRREFDPNENAIRLLDLSMAIARGYNPQYGWIERCHKYGYTAEEDVDAVRIQHIYWANIFGPSYIAKYGIDFFQKAPGWKKEAVSNDSFLYVLSPNLMGTGPKELISEVKAYFGINTARREDKE